MATALWYLERAAQKRIRAKVLHRDGLRCRYCGRSLSAEEVTLDHVTPLSAGGTNGSTNLVVACEECNLLLGNMAGGYEEKRRYVKMVHDLANVDWE